jgi:hypothetical protein
LDNNNKHKEIQGIVRNYSETLYFNKLENLEEMDTFLGTYNHSKLYQEDINHLSRSITFNEIKAAQSPKNEKSTSDGFSVNFNQTFKELTPTFLKLFH